ncbi:MAG TPA: tRNA lysidine(34) synthetase TilS, partial [Candidatus Binataceae bacterium]|nr:tRNA lysidine(34) synthetase TilS [Candidatus Binataceae bacterium]
EERAREARHAFLNRIADQIGATHIALAHHADDQAETVLMRLLRGAGLAGLGAMSERGPGRVVRPLLSLRRRDILAYLGELGAEFMEDSSNASRAPLRNRIRHDLLPLLEREYAPGVSPRLAGLASELRRVNDFVAREARRELGRVRLADGALNLERLGALDPALRGPVLRAALVEDAGSLRRFGRVHVDALLRLCLECPPSGELILPGGVHARRDYDRLQIMRTAQKPASFATAIKFDGVTVIPGAGLEFHARVLAPDSTLLPHDLNAAMFDLGALRGLTLVARSFARGDRIQPLGLGGMRKLSDVFIDRKVSRGRRGSWPVVVAGGDVLWLPGLVRSGHALITGHTERALRIEARESQT